MILKFAKRFASARAQLVVSVLLGIVPVLLFTLLLNQDWFWELAPETLRPYAACLPWLSVVIGLLALAAAWLGGERFILQQVRGLSRAVLRLTAGDLKTRSGLHDATGEIAQLARRFDDMATSLLLRQNERDEADRKLLNKAMQQAAVAAVGQCALTNRNLEVIYEQAVYRVAEMFAVEYALLLQRLPDGRLHPIAAYGLTPGASGETAARNDEGSQMAWTADTGEVSIVDDWTRENRFTQSPRLIELGVVSGAAVAIPTRGKPFGVLAAHTTHRREFSPDDVQFLLAIANVVGMATERIRAEQETEKIAAFIKENPNAALEISADATVTYFNDAAERLAFSLGRSHPQELLPETLPQIIYHCLLTGQGEKNLATKVNGHTISWVFQPLTSSGVVHCYGEDITMQLNLEAQLLQSEKMKTFGQFAAGIAHDFNNMLTIIQGHSGKLLTDDSLPPEAKESLTQVYSAGDRAARLTLQLLLTSRKNVMQPRLLDLREVVGSISKMLERLVGETIRLHFQCPELLPMVYADQSMVEQVVMNLASNARDAMPNGGVLAIDISETFVAEDYMEKYPDAVAGQYLKLQVTDSGCGMDEATRAHIFEPFFTTKDVGKGTGLGLATVFNITRQHNGWVEVASEPGIGSTFTVYLPASAESISEPTQEPPAEPSPVVGGDETVLIVEDEDMLRELARDVLRDCGYHTLEASSGRQALNLWEDHGRLIDLLVTDMVMPEGISGVALAEHLVSEKPQLKVVYMSGYTADDINPDLLQRTNASFIQKPYSHVELAKVVRECLDAAVG